MFNVFNIFATLFVVLAWTGVLLDNWRYIVVALGSALVMALLHIKES